MFSNLFNSFLKTAYAATEDVVGTISLPEGIPSDIGKTGDFFLFGNFSSADLPTLPPEVTKPRFRKPEIKSPWVSLV